MRFPTAVLGVWSCRFLRLACYWWLLQPGRNPGSQVTRIRLPPRLRPAQVARVRRHARLRRWRCWPLAWVSIIGMWKVFEKAGKPGWPAIIPFYNVYIMVQNRRTAGLVVRAGFIPFANLVLIVLPFDIAQKFGKGAGFGVGLLLLPFVFYPMLGYGGCTIPSRMNAPSESWASERCSHTRKRLTWRTLGSPCRWFWRRPQRGMFSRTPSRQTSACVYVALVRGYQRLWPPVPAGFVQCRYHPSCSEYSIEAVQRHGIARGLQLTVCRLCRCTSSVRPARTIRPGKAVTTRKA